MTPKVYKMETFKDGTKHIRQECADCGQLICHVKKTVENLEKVTA